MAVRHYTYRESTLTRMKLSKLGMEVSLTAVDLLTSCGESCSNRPSNEMCPARARHDCCDQASISY